MRVHNVRFLRKSTPNLTSTPFFYRICGLSGTQGFPALFLLMQLDIIKQHSTYETTTDAIYKMLYELIHLNTSSSHVEKLLLL